MRILYFDCFAGISGDMTLGAFIDLGVDKDMLIRELSKLNISGYKIKVTKKSKNGIVGTDVDVILNDYKQDHQHKHTHIDEVSSEHNHAHSHGVH